MVHEHINNYQHIDSLGNIGTIQIINKFLILFMLDGKIHMFMDSYKMGKIYILSYLNFITHVLNFSYYLK
jgi:hypothetical protein